MPKIEGKDLQFWWDGVEIPVNSINLAEDFDQIEITDSASPSTAKDYSAGRANRSFTVEAELYKALGAEVITGTLVAGTTYIVTGGSITETQGTFVVGQIFTSDGTGTASGTNKVKPLGERVTGEDLEAASIDGGDVHVTSIEYGVAFDQLDATDTETDAGEKESVVSRAERTMKLSGIVRSTEADQIIGVPPEAVAATLNFSDENSVSGSIVLSSQNITDDIKDFAKIDLSGRWSGIPTETEMGLAAGLEKTFLIVLKEGTTTDKSYTGSAIITQKTVTLGITDAAKISYTIFVNGAITRAVAN